MSLLKACDDRKLKEIRYLLRRPKDRRSRIEQRDNHNWNCLHHAVKSGSIKCIKYLLTIEELDTTAETFEGETALYIACSIPDVSLEIISILLEANRDLVYFVNNEEIDLLQCAIFHKRLDIVKLLIDHGAPVNNQDLDGDTALHVAVIEHQLNIVRYLLYETNCDPTIRNETGKTAYHILCSILLHKVLDKSVTTEYMDCFVELAQFTFDLHFLVEEEVSVFFDLIDFCHRNQDVNNFYSEIMKLFHMPKSSQYFVSRILQTNMLNNHCLVAVSVLQALNNNSFVRLKSMQFWSCFLQQLLTLYLADETLFYEYFSEILSTGYELTHVDQSFKFCEYLSDSESGIAHQKLFNFFTILILYEFQIDAFIQDCLSFLPRLLILNVFEPLSKLVIPNNDYKGSYIESSTEKYMDITESQDVDLVSHKFIEMSLQNLCRSCIRNYYFENYSHYAALKMMYSLRIPVLIRNFVCYNPCSYEFPKIY